jgi:hypothetical protein
MPLEEDSFCIYKGGGRERERERESTAGKNQAKQIEVFLEWKLCIWMLQIGALASWTIWVLFLLQQRLA